MNVRRTTLLIAIVLAIGTGWLTLTYLSSLRPAQNEPRQVLIATQDIPAREPVTSQMFRVETRSASSLQPDAVGDPRRAIGALALVTIPAGSQLTASALGNNVAFALPVRLAPGMRAVSIPIDRVKGVAGLIQPGDRVDVIAVPPQHGNGSPGKAVTILRGVLVLAVGNALEDISATPSPEEANAATVTLAVNPKQADLLAWADTNASIRLALRSPREPIRSQPTEQLTLSTGNDTLPAPAIPLLPPPAPVPAVGAPPSHTFSSPVQVIVGDKVVDPASAQ
ncbi:MAG: Flp pilus assembly protein CpaB [Candidatus Eremiobacteraeota bacterium]|nr:Flp pilus assembly protein CpaB [Candidatus Eremiobacteraeota bacterium]